MAAASGTEDAGDDVDDAAQTLRHQLIYNGEVLDIALDSIRSYKEGTQSLTYLDSSVYLAWSLLRMLERWGKGGGEEMYVRKKKMRKRKGKKGASATEEGEGVPDVEDIEEVADDDDVVLETMFTFETFEAVSSESFYFLLSSTLMIFHLEICKCRDHTNFTCISGQIQGV